MISWGEDAVFTLDGVDCGSAQVVREPAELDTPMRLSDHYHNRGLEFRPFL